MHKSLSILFTMGIGNCLKGVQIQNLCPILQYITTMYKTQCLTVSDGESLVDTTNKSNTQ